MEMEDDSTKGSRPPDLWYVTLLSRFWRDVSLPPDLDPATSSVSVAGVVVDRYAGTYKLVIVVGEVTKQEGGSKREQKVLIAFVFDSVSQSWSSHETLVNFLDPSLHVVSNQPFPHFGRFCHQIRVLFGCLRRGYVLLDLPTLPASCIPCRKRRMEPF